MAQPNVSHRGSLGVPVLLPEALLVAPLVSRDLTLFPTLPRPEAASTTRANTFLQPSHVTGAWIECLSMLCQSYYCFANVLLIFIPVTFGYRAWNGKLNTQLCLLSPKRYQAFLPHELGALIGFKCERVNLSGFAPD